MLFKAMIAVYSEIHTKPIKQNEELSIVEAGGKYSYHSASWRSLDYLSVSYEY
jgi:hypothetical protein